MSSDVKPDNNLIPKTIWRLDRGPRPKARGLYHLIAAYLATIAGTVLITFTWIHQDWQSGLAVTVYAVGVVALFGISAAYHRGPWLSQKAVKAWRAADHATIALFIAATYTPIAVMTLRGHWILIAIWVAAILSVGLTFFPHPRVLDVVTYLVLGWAVVPLIPAIVDHSGQAVVWLLAAGGIVYSLGAIFYALRWPGRNARLAGYHEHFHAATVVAAIVHMVAIWMLVV